MRNIAFPLPLARPGLSPGRVFGRIWNAMVALELAIRVRRERQLLANLDRRTLKDIGFSSTDAYAEAGRSFWDVPVDRLRS
jgi:uncharacterized protein YjiS (DUF1127 family)